MCECASVRVCECVSCWVCQLSISQYVFFHADMCMCMYEYAIQCAVASVCVLDVPGSTMLKEDGCDKLSRKMGATRCVCTATRCCTHASCRAKGRIQ